MSGYDFSIYDLRWPGCVMLGIVITVALMRLIKALVYWVEERNRKYRNECDEP